MNEELRCLWLSRRKLMLNLISFWQENLLGRCFTIQNESLITRHTTRQVRYYEIEMQWSTSTSIWVGEASSQTLSLLWNGGPRLSLLIQSQTSPTVRMRAMLIVNFKRSHKSFLLWPLIITS